jgi:hypothetical protein
MFMTIIECQLHFLDMLNYNLRAFLLAILNCYAHVPIFLYHDESIHSRQCFTSDTFF